MEADADRLISRDHVFYLKSVIRAGLLHVKSVLSGHNECESLKNKDSNDKSDTEGALRKGLLKKQETELHMVSGIYWTLAAFALLKDTQIEGLKHKTTGFMMDLSRSMKLESGDIHKLKKLLFACRRNSTDFCPVHRSNISTANTDICRTDDNEKYFEHVNYKGTPEWNAVCPPSCTCSLGFAPCPEKEHEAMAFSTCSAIQIKFLLDIFDRQIHSERSEIFAKDELNKSSHEQTENYKNSFLGLSDIPKVRRFIRSLRHKRDGGYIPRLSNSSKLIHSVFPCGGGKYLFEPKFAKGNKELEMHVCDELNENTLELLHDVEEALDEESDLRATFSCLLSEHLLNRLEARLKRSGISYSAVVVDQPSTGQNKSEEIPYCEPSSKCFGVLRGADADTHAVRRWILACESPGGGFALAPGGEAHAGAVFCALGCMALIGCGLPESTHRRLSRWLLSRQKQGIINRMDGWGFSGRPGKSPDSCYTWWVGASLLLMRLLELHFPKSEFSTAFTVTAAAHGAASALLCQHEHGGFSRAAQRSDCIYIKQFFGQEADQTTFTGQNNQAAGPTGGGIFSLLGRCALDPDATSLKHPDPFHTFFSIAGISAIAHTRWSNQLDKNGNKLFLIEGRISETELSNQDIRGGNNLETKLGDVQDDIHQKWAHSVLGKLRNEVFYVDIIAALPICCL